MRARPNGPGSAGASAPVRTEGSEHDQRVEEGSGPGGGDGGPGGGRGRRRGRHRVGRCAGPSPAGGVAPLCEGGGSLGTAVAPGVPGPAPPLAPRPVDPRLASRPSGVPPRAPWLTPAPARRGRRSEPEPAPACPFQGVPGPVRRVAPARRSGADLEAGSAPRSARQPTARPSTSSGPARRASTRCATPTGSRVDSRTRREGERCVVGCSASCRGAP